MGSILVLLLGVFLPFVCAVALAFIVLYYSSQADLKELHKRFIQEKYKNQLIIHAKEVNRAVDKEILKDIRKQL